MSVYFLLMTCLVGSALATTTDVPSGIDICGRRNPNISHCIQTSVQKLGPHLATGIPEWGIRSVEPFEMEEITFANTTDFLATARNTKFFGFSSYDLRQFAFDLKKLLIGCIVHFDVIRFEGDYELRTKLGSTVIAGKGPMTIVGKGITADVTIQLKTTEHKDETYIIVDKFGMKLEIEDYDAELGASKKTDPAVTDSINAVLKSNKDFLKAQMIPNMETSLSKVISKLANDICKRLPARIILPDRE